VRRICSVVTLVLVQTGAWAIGTLQLGEATIENNQVIVPVWLSGEVGGGVAALNFRLNYNPEYLRPLSAMAGTAAQGAGKQVFANAKDGEYIIVMVGMNETACSTGEVARIVLQQVGDGDTSQWGLGISNPGLASPDGEVIESRVAPQSTKPEAVKPGKPASSQNAARVVAGKGPAAEAAQANGEPAAGAVPAAAAVVTRGAVAEQRPGLQQLAKALREADRVRAGIAGPGNEPQAEPITDPQDDRASGKAAGPELNSESKPQPMQVAQARPGAATVENVVSQSPQGALNAPTPKPPTAAHAWIWGMAMAVVVIGAGGYLARKRLFGKIFPRREDA